LVRAGVSDEEEAHRFPVRGDGHDVNPFGIDPDRRYHQCPSRRLALPARSFALYSLVCFHGRSHELIALAKSFVEKSGDGNR